ncbi:MAG: DUF4838 domain-containing protein [Lentisphaeria bacterium]|nr:DUF4838 domain-containing protein [Lentisphaeria bacterium]
MKQLLTFILSTAVLSLFAAVVDPGKAVIVVEKNADGTVRFAGLELQRHLQMVTGKKIPIAVKAQKGQYAFLMGTPAGVKLAPEEARWEVTPTYTRIYGDSSPVGSPKLNMEWILSSKVKSGDLSAVYDFLEKQLGFLFLAPGPKGTSYPESAKLNLKEGSSKWIPVFKSRHLWPDRAFRYAAKIYDKKGNYNSNDKTVIPGDFISKTRDEYLRKTIETHLWLKQQRMGCSERYSFGHAFTRWWAKYGKKHPEYFALVNGKREPRYKNRADRVKICVSNPAVWKQIVADWAKQKDRRKFINVCENDSGNYCECKNCRALDMPPRPGKKWNDDLSDRYIYFANNVLRLARKIDPEVMVCHYAYSVYRFPPRREKVDPGVFIGFVPRMLDLDINEDMYKGWFKAGARKIYLRPNDFHVNTPLPMGFDKHIFSAFKMGVKYGISATSYDSLHGFWDISGLSDYLIARGNVDPAKDYEYWLNEYCSAYGAAAADVRAYYDYWRVNIWEKQLWPNRKAISEKGRYGNFRRGLMWDIHKYYKESDFDKTDALLKKGLSKKLTPAQKKRLETLLLSNTHSRLTFRALAAQGKNKNRAAALLLKFRRANKENLNINWERLMGIELSFGDCTGIRSAGILSDFADFEQASIAWHFKPDPKNAGEKEQWGKIPYKSYKNWPKFRVDTQWENQRGKNIPDSLKAQMKDYNGFGYYANNVWIKNEWKGKRVFLIFGAVDESAWVWVNGQYAGKRIYAKDDDWKAPFAIEITGQIDWKTRRQSVVVRVQDTAGAGGMWRPVMVAVK